MMMKERLKIILLEDSAIDAEILQRLLVKEGWNSDFKVVMSKDAFVREIEVFEPDLILADNSLPQFNASEALKIVRERLPGIPFILVTGSMSDEFAANIIKSGADDYILKDRLTRLPDAIDAAIRHRRAEKEKQAAYSRLIRSEEKFRNLLESAPDAMVIIDKSSVIQLVNVQTTKLFGYSRDEVIGKNIELLMSGWYKNTSHSEQDNAVESGEFVQADSGLELTGQRKDCSVFPVEISLAPLETVGELIILVALRDITERKKAEAEKRRLEKALEEERLFQQKLITEVTIQAQEKERNELGKELHDNINQILASVKMMLSMSLDNENKREEFIRKSIHNTNYAIEEIRTLSRTLVAPSLGEGGLKEALEQLIEDMSVPGKLKVRLVSDDDPQDKIDKNMELALYRIAQEQLNNIRKYAKAEQAVITIKRESGFLHFSISDNGIGFDPSKKAQGIGLKNIKSRVDFYSGKLNIISTPGQGCQLEIEMPL
mgnify:CR=1 FL=1